MGTLYYLICTFHKQGLELNKTYGCTTHNEWLGGYSEIDWRALLKNLKQSMLPKVQEFLEEHQRCYLQLCNDGNEPWGPENREKGWEVLMWEGGNKFTLTTDDNREEWYNRDD